MWVRRELKERTKHVMHRSYWIMFAVSTVVAILCGEFSQQFNNHMTTAEAQNVTFNLGNNSFTFSLGKFSVLLPSGATLLSFFALFAFIGFIIWLFYNVFVANPLSCGRSRYFLKNTQEKATFSTIFTTFQSDYMNIVKIMFVRDVKTFLWLLCFIIPGIYKIYEYRMIPYILAEDPSISMEDAFQKTKQMTRNQKFDIFILDVSFLGWYIVGAFLFGIGILFIQPYLDGTNAELYLALRSNQDTSY